MKSNDLRRDLLLRHTKEQLADRLIELTDEVLDLSILKQAITSVPFEALKVPGNYGETHTYITLRFPDTHPPDQLKAVQDALLQERNVNQKKKAT